MSEYPENLVPRRGWPRPLTAADVCAVRPDAVIGRRFPGTEADYFEKIFGKQVLKENAIPVHSSLNLSCCLTGTHFLHTDFAYHQKNGGDNVWNNEEINLDDYQKDIDYFIHEEYLVFGWNISELHQYQPVYNRAFNTSQDFDDFKAEIRKLNEDDDFLHLRNQEFDSLPVNEKNRGTLRQSYRLN